MGLRTLLSASLGLITVLSVGCTDGRFSFNYYDHGPRHRRVKRVHVLERHVCTRDCHDHYWDGSAVVVLSGHRHHRGCGHVWDSGHWITVGKGRARHSRPNKIIKVAHKHGRDCGCVYSGRGHKWIKVKKGHVHGPHCGHIIIEGRWSIHR